MTKKNIPASSKATANVIVKVTPDYIARESKPENRVYTFSYQVSIENNRRESIQLLNRHWKIFAGGLQIADVKGEGVVGQKPVIKTGEIYRYNSFSVVNSETAHMFGFYTFISENGEFFDVEIPEFQLNYEPEITLH